MLRSDWSAGVWDNDREDRALVDVLWFMATSTLYRILKSRNQGRVQHRKCWKSIRSFWTTGARNWGSFHSEHRQLSAYAGLHTDPTVQIHPDTCRRFGLSKVIGFGIENYLGRAKAPGSRKSDHAAPKIISCDHGLVAAWKRNRKIYMICLLISTSTILFPISVGIRGFWCKYKTTLVKIYHLRRVRPMGSSKKGILFDCEWCTGCHSCEISCQIEHRIPSWANRPSWCFEVGPYKISGENFRDNWQYSYQIALTNSVTVVHSAAHWEKDQHALNTVKQMFDLRFARWAIPKTSWEEEPSLIRSVANDASSSTNMAAWRALGCNQVGRTHDEEGTKTEMKPSLKGEVKKMSKKNADQTTQDMTKEDLILVPHEKPYPISGGWLECDSRNCLVRTRMPFRMRRVALHRRRTETCKSRGWFGAPAHFPGGLCVRCLDLPEVTNIRIGWNILWKGQRRSR